MQHYKFLNKQGLWYTAIQLEANSFMKRNGANIITQCKVREQRRVS
jgi:hypothetical protein